MANTTILRVRCAQSGTKRIEGSQYISIQDLYEKVRITFSLSPISCGEWRICRLQNYEQPLDIKSTKPVSSSGLSSGEMFFLQIDNKCSMPSTSNVTLNSIRTLQNNTSNQSKVSNSNSKVIEDDIDLKLSKLDGKIARHRNPKLCKHSDKSKCFHCTSFEPYDEDYLSKADPPVKFLSFHSYIRKLTGGINKGKFVNLENLRCSIKEGCKEHPPWPLGICSKCQPNAVTLTAQKYRHVDYIQFENKHVVDRFLDAWRANGFQRVGFLYGNYEMHRDIPLGIKAIVKVIYEPPQTNGRHAIELLEDENMNLFTNIMKCFGMYCIGWMFTDLLADNSGKGTVQHVRGHIDSHFLSAEECIMAAKLQNKFPNICKLSSTGHFGSKFVTVVVTGDKENQVHFDGYQVSDQAMALVNDDCLIPTRDVSELGYIRQSTNDKYVPDVFYTSKDQYGNEVTTIARPLPIEYLLVDMSVGFPMIESDSFENSSNITIFPVENRITDKQNFSVFCLYMSQFSAEASSIIRALYDPHVLYYLGHEQVLPLANDIIDLTKMVASKDIQSFDNFTKNSENWQTVLQLIIANEGASIESISNNTTSSVSKQWTCTHCTFTNVNNNGVNCEMCNLPKL